MSLNVRTYSGLFLVSFAALMAEVALTRFFSFSIWYHFAYMTISVALLGYGAAGSVYYAFSGMTKDGVERVLARWALIGAVLFAACLVLVSKVPFDPARLFPAGKFDWNADPAQYGYLVIFYVAVTAPFFAAGLCITILLSNAPRNIPQLYFADLSGAAAGCIAAVTLLTPLGAPGVVLLGALLFAVAGLLFGWPYPRWRWAAAGVTTVFAISVLPLAQVADVRPSQSKFLASMLKDGGIQTLLKRWSPVYRVDILGGKKNPIRFGRSAAWGVSDKFQGTGPENLVITHDGDASTMMYKFDGDFRSLDILDHSVLPLPYLILQHPEVLVIGVGGGVDILNALRNQAQHVTGVELNPVTVHALKQDFADYNGNVFNWPDVSVVVDEGRNFVRRGGKQYDLIQITGIDTLAAIYSGAYVLSESYLYTVEAMQDYLEHLTPNGVLTIVRGDGRFKDQPPRQMQRLVSVAIEALTRMGTADPASHIILTMSAPPHANIPIFSLMVRRAPFSDDQAATIAARAAREDFQIWHLPGGEFGNPISEFINMTPGQRGHFLAREWLNLYPTVDDQPFFFNFLKWRMLLRAASVRADYTFASGQLVLVAILVQSAIFALLLIVAPLFRVGRVQADARGWRLLAYFACLGIGFIFIEISYIQRFTLFLGSPVFSLSVILFTLLLSSGTGSLLSARLRVLADSESALRRLLLALWVLNLVYVWALPGIFQALLGNPQAVRIAAAVVLLAPAGLIMGSFLPVGMRVLSAEAPQMIPWAWAANGVASVVGSILSIVLAISIGFRAVNVVALGVYSVGVASMLGFAALTVPFTLSARVRWLRPVLARAALATLVAALALGSAEAALRLYHEHTGSGGGAARWEPEPQFGWTRAVSTAAESGAANTQPGINVKGLRDVDHMYAKPDGVFRILVLGNSYVEGMPVDLQRTFGRQLEAILNRQGGRRIEVINAGVQGFSTANELLFFRYEGYKYHPDLVLLAFATGSDVYENYGPLARDVAPPRFKRPAFSVNDDGSLLLQPTSAAALPPWWRQLQVVEYVRRRFAAVRRDGVAVAQASAAALYAPNYSPDMIKAWKLTDALVLALRDDVAARGGRLAVMLVDPAWVHDEQDWKREVGTDPGALKLDRGRPKRRLGSLLWGEHISSIDLSSAFEAAKGPERLFFEAQPEWTPAGHRVAAETAASSLVAQHLVPMNSPGSPGRLP